MNQRIAKINSLIKERVSELITRSLNLKEGIFVTVSKVDTTPDLRYTRVFVSVFPEKDSEYAIKTLKKESHALQKELNRKLHMKILPRLQFQLDSTEVEADIIEKLLNSEDF